MTTSTQELHLDSIDELIHDPQLGWLKGHLDTKITGELKALRLQMMSESELEQLLGDKFNAITIETWLTADSRRLRPVNSSSVDVATSLIPNIEDISALELLMIDLDQPWRRNAYSMQIKRVVQAIEDVLQENFTFAYTRLITRHDIFLAIALRGDTFRLRPWDGLDPFVELLARWGYPVIR